MLMKNSFRNIKSSGVNFYRGALKNFSSTKTEGSSISIRFHELYVKELERIQKNTSDLVAANYKVDNTKTPTEAYIHPYHSTKFPVYWSTKNLFDNVHEAVGTEPVSPHYESFVRSRRFLILTAGMMYTIQMFDSLNLNSFYGQHAVYELYTLLVFCIGLLEMRYLTQKIPGPRLTWFYEAYIQHEMKQFWVGWQDTVEEYSRPFLAISKEQIDYYLIHKEFTFIKKRSLSNFLENEKKNLEKHFYDRTINMLKTVEHYENTNVKNKIRESVEESLKIVLNKVESAEGRKSLHVASFESALHGLKTGKMSYEGDALLPLFISEIKRRIEPLKNLSVTEESKLFSLSPEQRKQIAENDHREKIEYLAKPPEVSSATVKNTETYKHIVTRMKKRIEATF